MRAIVCDKCGKVVLLEDDQLYRLAPKEIYTLVNEKDGVRFELCKECANELLAAVRGMKGEED